MALPFFSDYFFLNLKPIEFYKLMMAYLDVVSSSRIWTGTPGSAVTTSLRFLKPVVW